ncbi:hypothetical protein PIB30_064352, partial [Stylosanthes scabra]|nr:hypothetical protein [Stylosanthes scabra]
SHSQRLLSRSQLFARRPLPHSPAAISQVRIISHRSLDRSRRFALRFKSPPLASLSCRGLPFRQVPAAASRALSLDNSSAAT